MKGFGMDSRPAVGATSITAVPLHTCGVRRRSIQQKVRVLELLFTYAMMLIGSFSLAGFFFFTLKTILIFIRNYE